jgi:hypothetical protein
MEGEKEGTAGCQDIRDPCSPFEHRDTAAWLVLATSPFGKYGLPSLWVILPLVTTQPPAASPEVESQNPRTRSDQIKLTENQTPAEGVSEEQERRCNFGTKATDTGYLTAGETPEHGEASDIQGRNYTQ